MMVIPKGIARVVGAGVVVDVSTTGFVAGAMMLAALVSVFDCGFVVIQKSRQTRKKRMKNLISRLIITWSRVSSFTPGYMTRKRRGGSVPDGVVTLVNRLEIMVAKMAFEADNDNECTGSLNVLFVRISDVALRMLLCGSMSLCR